MGRTFLTLSRVQQFSVNDDNLLNQEAEYMMLRYLEDEDAVEIRSMEAGKSL
ncbi:hypothetical protein DAPPUDRAFT_238301 [Daphnia pulex]|uniref:Uncharacterized protein n=1 Tax=Daphnia pulex TaxID=6669 RepID=E9G624_DAPPU|nr:hypothetical protein DAPPUDRAFT_238301 [Daphnia pulex]|eukprot:EFX84863.1 hypothetical protein DAPPUDRAFT_238301 [Daphnia pulex]